MCTVESLLKDTPNKGHHSLQRTVLEAPKMGYPMVVIHFSPLKSGQPLYSGQKLAGPNVSFRQRFHFIHKLLYIRIRTYVQTYIHLYIWITSDCILFIILLLVHRYVQCIRTYVRM